MLSGLKDEIDLCEMWACMCCSNEVGTAMGQIVADSSGHEAMVEDESAVIGPY